MSNARASKLALWEEIFRSGLESDEAFRKALRNALERLHINTKRLSKLSSVSESLLYKILSGQRTNPRLSTYRKIVKTFKKLEGLEEGEPFIAVIAARPTLDVIETPYVETHGRRVRLREYAATTIEEVIIAAIRAQRDGAKAIVCAPIVSTTIEKIVRIPISACSIPLCRKPIIRAAETAASKMLMEQNQ